jgi:hypothetical protein
MWRLEEFAGADAAIDYEKPLAAKCVVKTRQPQRYHHLPRTSHLELGAKSRVFYISFAWFLLARRAAAQTNGLRRGHFTTERHSAPQGTNTGTRRRSNGARPIVSRLKIDSPLFAGRLLLHTSRVGYCRLEVLVTAPVTEIADGHESRRGRASTGYVIHGFTSINLIIGGDLCSADRF